MQVPDDIVGYAYEWVASHIESLIADGSLPPRTAFPSERDLADLYGVSLGTARHATRLLRSRGLVVTIRSKGTYVTPREG
ncbi:winged helix-turn-helix transcriptional regulator [Amycolatopsis rhizosphaerae]|uniref:Winged helix-turn-helix transcriptional regulator n=2 Tax=Amycolatopsis rhizosphaerae TaxID=2053003 RepID=A0A558C4Y1_9PSEU|nr:winged helix-turn-helix domain-containing protein [Amycolatopsis rhizosphaerae]TVT43836.1 winged helix-turn-helix transcriptional regulator [Amycolatopsis rhizosphaerae]